MIKNKKYILLSFLLVSFLACEKVPFDYRNIYVGNYDFTIYNTEWSWVTGMYTRDTTKYNGNVSYGERKSSVLINYSQGKEVDLNVDRNGSMSAGEFSKDTLKLGYTTQTDGNVRKWVNIIGVKND